MGRMRNISISAHVTPGRRRSQSGSSTTLAASTRSTRCVAVTASALRWTSSAKRGLPFSLLPPTAPGRITSLSSMVKVTWISFVEIIKVLDTPACDEIQCMN